MTLLATMLSAAWGASVSGAVLGPDGSPLSSATVYAINNRMQAAQTETQASGEFTFSDLPLGGYRLLAVPDHSDNYASRYFPSHLDFCDAERIDVARDPTDLTITVPVGRQMSGQVVENDGSPLAHVQITADSEDALFSRRAVTDDNGTFVLSGLEPDSLWTLQASKSGFPHQWFGDTYVSSDATLLDSEVDGILDPWLLRDGIGVAGEVTGPDGPINGATVRIFSTSQIVQTVTDSDGTFMTTGLPPGDVIAWTSAEGVATTYWPTHDRPQDAITTTEDGEWIDNLNFNLPTESRIYIQLNGDAPRKDGDLSNLAVVLYNDDQTVGRSGQSDEDGLVEFRGLHGGTYTAFAYASEAGHPDDWLRASDGSIMAFTVEAEASSGIINVSLPPSITVEGLVKDDDGTPISDASVVFSRTDSDGAFAVGTSDQHGRFEIVGLPEAEWIIVAQSSQRCPSDPGHVITYWPNSADPYMAHEYSTAVGTSMRSIEIVLPKDGDHDAMSDRWERRYNLDLFRDDSAEDPDNDGANNLMEFRLRTNPRVPDGEWLIKKGCACSGAAHHSTSFWLAALLILFSRRDAVQQRKQAPHV